MKNDGKALEFIIKNWQLQITERPLLRGFTITNEKMTGRNL